MIRDVESRAASAGWNPDAGAGIGLEYRRVVLGGMVLENVPTDVLTGAAPGTPILLGRELLRPFVVSFDPRARLIRIALR